MRRHGVVAVVALASAALPFVFFDTQASNPTKQNTPTFNEQSAIRQGVTKE
jgi:hypothetical protein